jgi:hypothetical protein
MAAWIDTASSSGVFQRPISPEERDALVFILWTYAEGIVTSLHTSNIPVTPETIHGHFITVLYLLKAYLRPPVWEELSLKTGLS